MFLLGPHPARRTDTGGKWDVWEIDMSRVLISNINLQVNTVEKGIPGKEKCAMIQRKKVCE